MWRGYQEISASYWAALRGGAKRRNLEFSISVEYAWGLYEQQNSLCALSGLPIDFRGAAMSSDKTASLDRIDSKEGYIEGNVQWLHKAVNRMKLDSDEKDFLSLCCAIATYQTRKDTED
jgi:hypothetical protein